jgi:hypothetical protein
MGCAKNIILNGLEDVCFVFVSRHLVLEGADTFACSDGHGVPCPYVASVNNNAPSPCFFVSVADKGLKSSEQSLESKKRQQGCWRYGA